MERSFRAACGPGSGRAGLVFGFPTPGEAAEAERSPGEDAEWDRNRPEEDPVLWELAQTDKAHREELAKSPPYDVLERMVADVLPEEVEPCLEVLRGAGGEPLGAACQPVWRKGKFWCALCDQDVILMRAVKDAV